MESKLNQALTLHPIFFDSLNKRAAMDQGVDSIHYIDDTCGTYVYENGDVEFNFYAPEAKRVEVAGLGGSMGKERIALELSEDGHYTKTVSGIKPGFHYYNWYVDDVIVRNPKGAFCYGCFEAMNFLEIPEKGKEFYYLKYVPHGDVQIRMYTSTVNQHLKTCYVYTPPGYGKTSDKKYPVLYLLHGVGENETGWIWNGKLNLIMDNLIAEKKCAEMIIVMCCGYAFEPDADPVLYPGDFDSELIYDCIPYIEKNFNVKKGRGNRAIAGLSLGSAQAALSASMHKKLFAWLGVFSGITYDVLDTFISDKKNQMKLIFLSCGEGEEDINKVQEEHCIHLNNNGVYCVQKSYAGYHEWHVWRESLYDFVQHLFTGEWYSVNQEFEYVPAELSKDQLEKQTYEAQSLFFDPVYKKVVYAVDEEGRPAGRYRDVHQGVEIINSGEVRFWFFAPNAEEVEVDLYGRRVVLQKSECEDGYWTGTLSEISPGFYYHSYFVNKTAVINPMAPLGYGGFCASNFFEMPEPAFQEYKISDVLHGAIHMNYYPSSETGRMKLCYVYTPPGYNVHDAKRYPVLYLQHGGGENETGWIWQGKIWNIADNLIADGRMEEMLIVMNSGYAFRQDGNSHHSLSSFPEELPKACVPFIDRVYKTMADREYRAMAGLSMGGMQSQKIVFHNIDLFASIGIFSGGLLIHNHEEDYRNILFDREKFCVLFKLFFVACGTKDSFYEQTKANVDEVLSYGVPLDVFEEEGYHDWTFWRHCAAVFLQKLFK